jgi:hypothetical protein
MPEGDEKALALEKAYQQLTPKEVAALQYFQKAKQAALSEETADKLYDLFRQGKTTDDIRKLNTSYGLGQIVAARLMYLWDARLAEERTELVNKLPGQVMQVQSEAIDFIARLLAVNHVLYNEKIDKYLQTKDPQYLEGLPTGFSQIKEYRALLESLTKVTGQSNRKVVEHRGSVSVNHEKQGGLSPQEAGDILDVLVIPGDEK